MSVFIRELTLTVKLVAAADGSSQEIDNRISSFITQVKGVLAAGEQIREVRVNAIPWAPTATTPKPDEQRGGNQEVFGV